MKRSITLLLALTLGCAGANAQYRSLSYEGPSDVKIVQIDEVENSTVVYFTFTAPKGNLFASWNDETSYVNIAGAYKKYKAKTVVGIARSSDNENSYMDKAGESFNFAIEFEKFPLDSPFDLIEDSESSTGFNFSKVTVNTAQKADLIPADDFLAYASVPVTGTYYTDGQQMRYWRDGGLVMTMHFVTSEEYGKLFKIYLEVANNTGRPVDLITSNIKVSAENTANGKITEVPLLSYNDIDQKVVNNLGWYSSPSSRLSDDLRWRANSKSRDGDDGMALAYGTLSLIASMADAQNAENYQAALDDERANATSNYLRSNTMQDGAVYGGFVAVKDRKPNIYNITFKIGKKEYKSTCRYR